MDCVLYTAARADGCPRSLRTAMSYGVPVAGTAVGGVPEMIDDNGILLTAEAEGGEIREALYRIAALPAAERRAMRRRSEEKWRAMFGIENCFPELLELLER